MGLPGLRLVVVLVLLCSPLAGQVPATLFEPPDGQARRVTSSSPDRDSNDDTDVIAAGAEITLADLVGPGVVTRLWLSCESLDPYYARLLVLRARWEGESEPSVEVPVGDFFAVGHGLHRDVDSALVHVTAEGRARTSYWPMPFQDSALLTLRNDSQFPVRILSYHVDWRQRLEPFSEPPRTFHAHYRQRSARAGGDEYLVADLKGQGHYVGTVLSLRCSELGWPGEGDDRFYVDGDEQPTLQGTGTEDYFGHAWGLREEDGCYQGVTVAQQAGAQALYCAYRWHALDPVAFDTSLRVTFELLGLAHRGEQWLAVKDRSDHFASVAMWYQAEPHSPLESLPAPADRLPFQELRFEPEILPDALQVAAGAQAPTVQVDRFLAFGRQVLFTPPDSARGQLALSFEVPYKREYDLVLRLTSMLSGGQYEVLLDGEHLAGPFDLYRPRPAWRELLLGRRLLSKGPHQLLLYCQGRHSLSRGFDLGFDSFLLRW
jgi:hypothetical protein